MPALSASLPRGLLERCTFMIHDEWLSGMKAYSDRYRNGRQMKYDEESAKQKRTLDMQEILHT